MLCEVHEWLAGVLWTVVQDYHLWDVVSCEDAFHPPDNVCRHLYGPIWRSLCIESSSL